MKKLICGMLAACLGLMLLAGCGKAKLENPELMVEPEFLKLRLISYETLRETEDDAESTKGDYMMIPVVEGRAQAALPLEATERTVVHLEGLLGGMMKNLPRSMTPEEMAEKLGWKGGRKLEAVLTEDGDPGKQIGKRFVAIALDTDGDDTLDAVLEINLDYADSIDRKSKVRLVWMAAEQA